MPVEPARRQPNGERREAATHRRYLLRGLQIAAAIAVLYFLILYMARSWQSVRAYEWVLHPGWLALSGVAFLAFYGAQAVAWWLLLRGVGLRSPLTLAVATWAKSIVVRYVPGTVFMFVGRAWMCHAQGLAVERVSAAMVYEQALGVCSALVALAVLFPFWDYRPVLAVLALALVPIMVVLLHPRVFAPLANRLLLVLRRAPLGVVLGFRHVLGLLGYFTVCWLLAGVGAWSLGRAVVGLPVEALPAVVVAYALAYVAGMVAFFVPSGIGVREAVLTASMSRWLPGGVALAWALFLRLWVTVAELVFVGVAVLVDTLARRRRTR